jgi:dihydroorotate dehydrogenase electron transfer subunit
LKRIMLCRVIENRTIAEDTLLMVLKADSAALADFDPGVFVNIRIMDSDSPLLRRPISVHETDIENGILKLIYKVVGEGTRKLSEKKQGDIVDIFGPLGTGFPIQSDAKSVVLIGGGVGIPPLYELGKRLAEKGVKVTTVLGARNAEGLFCLEEFGTLGRVVTATEDGSHGVKGFVTDAIREGKLEFDCLYACGPKPMLKALDLEFRGKKEGYLSFEERMACGIGACYGCMTKTKDGLKRVCKDGPVFRLGEAVYE